VDTSSFFWSHALRVALLALLLVAIGFLALTLLRPFLKPRLDALLGAPDRAAPGPDRVPSVSIPTWALALSLLIGVLGLGITLVGSQVTGVSWDEPFHVAGFQEFFRSGWYVPRSEFLDGAFPDHLAYAYGPVPAFFAHPISVLTGTETWWNPATDAAAYVSTHLGLALISLVGVAAVAGTAAMLTRSWKWSLVAVAVLVSIPLWTGHAMFNPKDSPAASGFAIFTFGLVAIGLRMDGARRRELLATAMAVSLGVLLAMGSRPGLWPVLVVSALGCLVAWLLVDRRGFGLRVGLVLAVRRLGVMVLGGIVGYLSLVVIYPNSFGNPLRLLAASASATSDFPAGGYTLTAGMELPVEEPAWYYLPVWFGSQLPIIILISATVGLIAVTYHYLRLALGREQSCPVAYGALPVIAQTLIVPLAALVLGSPIYGGLRQLLFVLPAVALLAALGAWFGFSALRSSERRWLVPATWGVLLAGLAIPVIAQLQLFPYTYAYFNVPTLTRPVNGNWDVDGWWLSGRELVGKAPSGERVICVESEARPVADCAAQGVIAPFMPTDPRTIPLQEDEFIALDRTPRDVLGADCRTVDEVSRRLLWQEVVLSQAEVCKASLANYPQGGVRLDGIVPSADRSLLWGWHPYLLWGWGSPAAQGVQTSSSSSSLGFTYPQDELQEPLSLSVTAEPAPMDGPVPELRVFLNSYPVGTLSAAAGGAQTGVFSVPTEALQALGDGRILVRFQASEGSEPAGDGGAGPAAGPWRIDRVALDPEAQAPLA